MGEDLEVCCQGLGCQLSQKSITVILKHPVNFRVDLICMDFTLKRLVIQNKITS